MSSLRRSLSAGLVVLSSASLAPAADLFSDPGQSLANYTTLAETDSTAAVVDYSTLGIPEAPRRIAGSTATTGIQMTANKGDATAAISAINLVLGSTPTAFTGTHTLSFDVWMNVPTGATSTTEDFLAGTARSSATAAIFNNFRTARGNGSWIYLTSDNGGAVDYAQFNNGSRDTGLNDTDPALAPKLNAAFTNNIAGNTNASPANQWAKVDMVQDGAVSYVFINNVLFSTDRSTNQTGFAWIGYEDFASSIGTGVSGIFDNIRVSEGNTVPEPTAVAAAVPLAGLLLGRRRRR